MKRDLTVVMPALNEEKNISAALDNTLSALDDSGIDGEIIVIDDGSSDTTGRIVNEKMGLHDRIKMIRHEAPKGIGASFWDGVDKAAGDMIVMLPGDNENDPWEIFRYYSLLEHVDIVVPFVFNREARPLFRNILSLFYRFIINTTFLVTLNYTNGTILYRKSLLTELGYRRNDFFFQTDILIRMVKRGYLFAEVPYRIGMRKSGLSKAVSLPSLITIMRGYLRLVKDFYFDRDKNTESRFSGDSLTAVRKSGIPKTGEKAGRK